MIIISSDEAKTIRRLMPEALITVIGRNKKMKNKSYLLAEEPVMVELLQKLRSENTKHIS